MMIRGRSLAVLLVGITLIPTGAGPVFSREDPPTPPAAPFSPLPAAADSADTSPTVDPPSGPRARRSAGVRRPGSTPGADDDSKVDPVRRALSEARGLLRAGRTEEAIVRLRALQTDHPDDFEVVQLLGVALESTGQLEAAIQLFRSAADRMDDPGPALVRLERYYRERGDWVPALQVCLEYHERVENPGGWVTNEIESLIRTDRVGGEAIPFLEEASRRHPEDLALRELLVHAYLYDDQVERAIRDAVKLDREQKGQGALLFRVATTAEEKGNLEGALAAYEHLLDSDPAVDLRRRALHQRARTLRALSRHEESLAAFDEAVAAGGSEAVQARLDKAQMLSGELGRPEEALATYRDLLAVLDERPGARQVSRADEVRLSMAECHLVLGRPSEAQQIYAMLADSAGNPEVRAEALFQVGEMMFYQGRLREAEETWYRLTDENPRGRWVNDALERILLLGENADEGGVPLTALAQAEYQRRLGRVEKGLGLLEDALREFPESRACDDLMAAKTDFLLDLGRIAPARATADSLSVRYPDSPRVAHALRRVADHLLRSGETTEAQAVYLEVLMRFPDSIDGAEARAALQRLRGESSEGPVGTPEESPAPRPDRPVEGRG